MTDSPRAAPPPAVTAATVAVWVSGVLALLLAFLVTAGSELREAEFGTPGLDWWLVAGVAAQFFLALAGVVALRARRSRWVLAAGGGTGLLGAVAVWGVVGSPTLSVVVAAGSIVALIAALGASARDWVAGSS